MHSNYSGAPQIAGHLLLITFVGDIQEIWTMTENWD